MFRFLRGRRVRFHVATSARRLLRFAQHRINSNGRQHQALRVSRVGAPLSQLTDWHDRGHVGQLFEHCSSLFGKPHSCHVSGA
eukprot:7628242-Pyramimonas_sp.AAC.1